MWFSVVRIVIYILLSSVLASLFARFYLSHLYSALDEGDYKPFTFMKRWLLTAGLIFTPICFIIYNGTFLLPIVTTFVIVSFGYGYLLAHCLQHYLQVSDTVDFDFDEACKLVDLKLVRFCPFKTTLFNDVENVIKRASYFRLQRAGHEASKGDEEVKKALKKHKIFNRLFKKRKS